jgi:hypothetical protein
MQSVVSPVAMSVEPDVHQVAADKAQLTGTGGVTGLRCTNSFDDMAAPLLVLIVMPSYRSD